MKKTFITLAIAITAIFIVAQPAVANTCKWPVKTQEVCRNYHTKTYTENCQRWVSTWVDITYATTYVDQCGNYSTKHWKTTKWVKNEKCW